VSDGTAYGASKSETRVKLKAAELLGLNSGQTGLQVDGGHCDRCEERVDGIGRRSGEGKVVVVVMIAKSNDLKACPRLGHGRNRTG